MKLLKEKVVYQGYKENLVEDKNYITVYYINDEAEREAINYIGEVDDLNNLKNGDFVDLHIKLYRSRDNYFKVIGASVYKIEKTI